MDVRCPQCDYVATGATEEDTKENLRMHARERHNADDDTFERMWEDIKQKVSGMLNR